MLNEKLSWISIIAGFFVVVLSIHTGFYLGYKYRDIMDKIEELRNPPEPEVIEEPQVLPTDRRFVNENTISQEGSNVVEPKSPQLIEFEEEEALKRMQNA